MKGKKGKGEGVMRREKEFILKIYDLFVQMKIKYNIFYKNYMFVRVLCF